MVEFICVQKGRKKWVKCEEHNGSLEKRTKEFIELSQQKSTFRGLNKGKKEYYVHSIDECIIQPTANTPKRGDYLLFEAQIGHFWLIELKGNSVDDAYKQIIKTYEQLSNKFNEWKLNGKRYACVVLSGYKSPTSISASLDITKKNLRKKGFLLIDNYNTKTWGKLIVDLDDGSILKVQ